MLGAREILELLEQREITPAQIARALKLPSSRVAEIFNFAFGRPGKPRKLTLEEAKILVEKFDLEERLSPLSVPTARLLVLYAADALGAPVDPDDPRVEELARDLRAFSQFAADPQVRESESLVEGFFQGLRLAPGRRDELSA